MPNLNSQLESILFVAASPVGVKKLIKLLKAERADVVAALENIQAKLDQSDSGISLLNSGDDWQMVAKSDNHEFTEKFIKAEVSGELTRPQLETLTVIAYCGPITRPELEEIRAVNCSMILRNLLIRGLIKESESGSKLLPVFEVSLDFLRHLGLNSTQDLPDYETLHEHEHITASRKAEE